MQKRIAILVAMDKEYDLLHNMLNIKEVALDEKKENERYVIGTSKSCDDICVMLTKCGIGKVNSALVTASVIKNFHPHIVVSSGVCG
jgi:adenosylhomocysteine nucleosidase